MHPESSSPEPLGDEVIELRLIRIVGPEDAVHRAPDAQFIAAAPEYRFAIHRKSDGLRVGRIHVRITGDPVITRAIGHCGYEVDETHRCQGYATRALRLIRSFAWTQGVSPLQILIAPANVPSRKAAQHAGFALLDIVPASPEALALGLDAHLCRYVANDG